MPRRPSQYALLWVALSPALPQIVGSVFNIWYNVAVLEPLLTPSQLSQFHLTILSFNLAIYPIAIVVWISCIRTVQRAYGPLWRDAALTTMDEVTLRRAQARSINLPWWLLGVAGAAWLICIPVFLFALEWGAEELCSAAYLHLPCSFLIGGAIATTQGFFLVELITQRFVFPVLFHDDSPSDTPGGRPLSLRWHFLMWALAAGVCPIVSLVLLNVANVEGKHAAGLSLYVGAVGITFCVATAWLASVLIESPVRQLRDAAQRITDGDLDVEIQLRRADDFGPLIDDMNEMVAGLREKEHIEETFGRHMGRRAAEKILARNPLADGQAEEVTVLFADIRGFTTRSSEAAPGDIVALLNRFFSCAVEVIEEHHGMVNKYLGDGMMVLFDESDGADAPARRAVASAFRLMERLAELNLELEQDGVASIRIGIGIHCGPAIVGSIGSPRRQEYTAIGDTVNCAARIQELTKELGDIVISDAVYSQLQGTLAEKAWRTVAEHQLRGRASPLTLYST